MNRELLRLFSLRRDQQDPDVVDAAMRDGAQLGGTNLWVLFFAILIASVGLNVNSTAVIIGAMLVSPLMGPIVGIGYGAAVANFSLIRSAATNLAVFTGLSLATSTLYFALSPLDVPQSELLARTSPTLWDVLIAAFGGAAGMVAQTRRTFNNIVPGVAIATALMPPLCTTGFGLAHGRWDMVAGAFYLFTINGVFIAAATLAMARILRLPSRDAVDPAVRTRHRLIIGAGLLTVLVPSVVLGVRFVQHEVFANGALAVARELQSQDASPIVSYEVDGAQRLLRLTVVGAAATSQIEARARELLQRQGLQDSAVVVRRAGEETIDLGRLRRERDALKESLLAQIQQTSARVALLEAAASAASTARNGAAAVALANADAALIAAEIRAQWPEASTAAVGFGQQSSTVQTGAEAVLVTLTVPRALRPAERERLERWLGVRAPGREVIVTERVVGTHAVAQR